MSAPLLGIHHVSAIASDPQANVDFYTGTLGLRLVKLTVNFDDPGSYHLYYGDASGRPGSLVTFFVWPGSHRGRQGPPQVTATAFSIPRGSMESWSHRLGEAGIEFARSTPYPGEESLSFADPDGLALELVEPAADDPRTAVGGGPVPLAHAIRGIHGITMSEEGYEATAALLGGPLGFRAAAAHGSRFRYECGDGGPGAIVDVLCMPAGRHGSPGAGVVHHVAWRAPDEASQREWRALLVKDGFNVSPVMERQYFRSIYFREPGGVLFEIATDSPGFAIDEEPTALGTALRLPPWLEALRPRIEKMLPPLRLPPRYVS